MRTLLLVFSALAIVALLPGPAAAQQQGAMTISLVTPETLAPGSVVTFNGLATITVDITGMTATNGIPVTYSIAQIPAWATAVISPQSDVFPTPMGFPAGASYTVTKPFIVTIIANEGPAFDTTDILQLAATTSPGPFGQSIHGKGAVAVSYDAPDEPGDCLEHGLTDAQIAALSSTAVKAWNDHEDAKANEDADGEVTVQNVGASPIPIAGAAVGGFAVLGAGVGLLMRRKFRN